MGKKLILASASPRRKELLSSIGLSFDVIPADIDESIEGSVFSRDIIEKLACDKVMNVAGNIDYPAVIIGSDTMVVINNKVLGKPVDEKDAATMLEFLSGKMHHVMSSIAVYDTETKKMLKTSVTSEVKFRELTEEEICRYVETGEPLDKAGAYAIQGKAAIFVENIKGSYSNIVGICLYTLAEMLAKVGVRVL